MFIGTFRINSGLKSNVPKLKLWLDASKSLVIKIYTGGITDQSFLNESWFINFGLELVVAL